MKSLTCSAVPKRFARPAVALALALAVPSLGACSSNRGYAEPGMATYSLPPRPPAAMIREPARPYGTGYNLGSSYEPPRAGQYRWNGNPNRIQEGVAPPNLTPPAVAAVAANGERTIVVRSGDTLFSLSRHYGVSVAALAEHNRLVAPAIHAGQTLVLPPAAR